MESDYEKGGICRSDICAVGRGWRDGCYVGGYGYSDFRGPAKYQPCQDAYEKVWRDLEWDHPRWDDREMSCDLIPESTRRALQMCPECIDEGSTFVRYDQSCKLSAEHAEKQRKAEEKKRECDRQATEKKNQCLAQPALGTSLGIDGVHATSFTLGALVTLTLVAVAYFVRRPRGTQMTDSRRAYGATTVQ